MNYDLLGYVKFLFHAFGVELLSAERVTVLEVRVVTKSQRKYIVLDPNSQSYQGGKSAIERNVRVLCQLDKILDKTYLTRG